MRLFIEASRVFYTEAVKGRSETGERPVAQHRKPRGLKSYIFLLSSDFTELFVSTGGNDWTVSVRSRLLILCTSEGSEVVRIRAALVGIA